MLTLAAIRTPERVVDHFAAVHRYGGATRPTATWFGKGAALEGLRDPVELACLLPLLDGQLDEETLLGRGKGDDRAHRPGLALMLSAPKSVSLVALAVLWTLPASASADARAVGTAGNAGPAGGDDEVVSVTIG